jgi:hypothetical protein
MASHSFVLRSAEVGIAAASVDQSGPNAATSSGVHACGRGREHRFGKRQAGVLVVDGGGIAQRSRNRKPTRRTEMWDDPAPEPDPPPEPGPSTDDPPF